MCEEFCVRLPLWVCTCSLWYCLLFSISFSDVSLNLLLVDSRSFFRAREGEEWRGRGEGGREGIRERCACVRTCYMRFEGCDDMLVKENGTILR